MKIGNLIELITTYTGIKYLVETYHSIRGTKCNCDKRKDALNYLEDFFKIKFD